MGRLFAGTPWDRPPTCERCGKLESECDCPPIPVESPRVSPSEQTAWLRVEKRPKGKVVTVVRNLVQDDEALRELASRLKTACGAGGTVKDGTIEIQGDRLSIAESALISLGYGTKRR